MATVEELEERAMVRWRDLRSRADASSDAAEAAEFRLGAEIARATVAVCAAQRHHVLPPEMWGVTPGQLPIVREPVLRTGDVVGQPREHLQSLWRECAALVRISGAAAIMDAINHTVEWMLTLPAPTLANSAALIDEQEKHYRRYEAGDLDESRTGFHNILRTIHPFDPYSHAMLGAIELAKGDCHVALGHLATAHVLWPEDEAVLNNLILVQQALALYGSLADTILNAERLFPARGLLAPQSHFADMLSFVANAMAQFKSGDVSGLWPAPPWVPTLPRPLPSLPADRYPVLAWTEWEWNAPKNVFISYRRSDTEKLAISIEKLGRHLCTGIRLFRDQTEIVPGTRWRKKLRGEIESSDVMLALVGAEWVSTEGLRRLRDPDDMVAAELEYAMAYGVTVLPVLINSTELPSREALPDRLRPFLGFQAVRLSPLHLRECVELIVRIVGLIKKRVNDQKKFIDEVFRPGAAPLDVFAINGITASRELPAGAPGLDLGRSLAGRWKVRIAVPDGIVERFLTVLDGPKQTLLWSRREEDAGPDNGNWIPCVDGGKKRLSGLLIRYVEDCQEHQLTIPIDKPVGASLYGQNEHGERFHLIPLEPSRHPFSAVM